MRCISLLFIVLSAQFGGLAQGADGQFDADVIVIGLGPVGNYLCHLLSAYGAGRVLAFEKHDQVYWAPRAVSWDDYTLRSGRLISPDLSDWMYGHVQAISENWNIPDCSAGLRSGAADQRNYCGCDDLETNEGWKARNGLTSRPPVVGFHQPTWERHLRAELGSLEGVESVFNVEVVDFQIKGDSCWVKVQDIHSPDGPRVYSARYCVAADGASSVTRQRLGLTYEGETFGDQPWIVIDTEIEDEEYLKTSWLRREGAGFIMNWKCPFVFVPTPAYYGSWWEEAQKATEGVSDYEEKRSLRMEYLRKKAMPYQRMGADNPWIPGTAFRFEFLLETNTSEQEAMSDGYVEGLLKNCAEVDPAKLKIQRKVVYTFSARRAEKWRVGPLMLAGDAAHCMPPFQGQGMNSGLRDVINLAWKINLVLKGLAPDSLLNTFEPERRTNLEQVTQQSIELGKIVMERDEGMAWARDKSMTVLNWFRQNSPMLERLISDSFFPEPPHISTEESMIAKSTAEAEQKVAGKLMPSPKVRQLEPRHKEVAHLDEFLCPHGFTALFVEPGYMDFAASRGPLSEENLRFLHSLNTTTVSVKLSSGRNPWSWLGIRSGTPADFAWSGRPSFSVEGLPSVGGVKEVVDAEGHFTKWVNKHNLFGQYIVVRPDRYIFGHFRSMNQAAAALKRELAQAGRETPKPSRSDEL